MRLLILAMHAPDQAPGQRFRFEQYLDALRARGVEVNFSWLVTAESARILYSPGNILRKVALTLRSVLLRILQIPSFRTYDVIFVQRQALFVGGPFLERLARASRSVMTMLSGSMRSSPSSTSPLSSLFTLWRVPPIIAARSDCV